MGWKCTCFYFKFPSRKLSALAIWYHYKVLTTLMLSGPSEQWVNYWIHKTFWRWISARRLVPVYFHKLDRLTEAMSISSFKSSYLVTVLLHVNEEAVISKSKHLSRCARYYLIIRTVWDWVLSLIFPFLPSCLFPTHFSLSSWTFLLSFFLSFSFFPFP